MQQAAQPKVIGEYFTRRQLAGELDVSLQTIDVWHKRGLGPRRSKIGHTILYHESAVREWLQSNEQR